MSDTRQKPRRICVYGGPGSGKTTLAARIFVELKLRHQNVELVQEWIKLWAIEGRRPEGRDQTYVFAKQQRAEEVRLRAGTLLVSDSPLLLNAAYAAYYRTPDAEQILRMAQRYDEDFTPLNLVIHRTVPYQTAGRYQDDAGAREFDDFLDRFLEDNSRDIRFRVSAENFVYVMDTVTTDLGL